MATVIYKCPNTGMRIQRWFEDDVTAECDEQTFISTECPLCTRVHLVNPISGKVAGGDDD